MILELFANCRMEIVIVMVVFFFEIDLEIDWYPLVDNLEIFFKEAEDFRSVECYIYKL